MAIKPVEYVKDSSTAGFAVAGDEKTITKSNANTIKKDVDQGNTKDLDSSQKTYLDGKVDYDNIDYTADEKEKVGEQQIDTTGEDGEDLSEKDQKGAAAASTGITVAASAASVGAAVAVALSGAAAAKINNGFVGMVLGGIVTGLAATTYALSFPGTFDPNLEERKNQTNNAASNNETIQSYYDALASDMQMMEEDSKSYTELSEQLTQSQVDTITEVAALQGELQVYQAQGNSAKVAELKAQIADLQKSSEESNKEPQEEMDGLKGNIESYTANNAEAVGVKTSGDTVSGFLKDGDPMEKMAKTNQILSYAGAAACLSTFIIPKMLIADVFAAGVGTALFLAAGVVFGLTAGNMGKRADEEGAAVDAGDEMSGYLASLQENIDGQADYYESTSGEYEETDAASTELVSQNQEAADQANGPGAQGANGQPKQPKPAVEPNGAAA